MTRRPLPLRRRTLLGLAGLPLAPAAPARALSAPDGPVVLTVGGRVRHGNDPRGACFDMAMLARLPQHSLATRTPWYRQARRFTGPRLRDVMAAAGAQGQRLRATALNDYRVDIPFDDIERLDVLLARLLDGQPMAVRDQGPLLIIYPFDQDPSLRNPRYYSRCVWQLAAIEVA